MNAARDGDLKNRRNHSQQQSEGLILRPKLSSEHHGDDRQDNHLIQTEPKRIDDIGKGVVHRRALALAIDRLIVGHVRMFAEEFGEQRTRGNQLV